MRKNIILDTDAYKLTHHLQYPAGLTKLYSYGEPRVGGKYPFISFFGLQMIIQDHFLQPVTREMIQEAYEEAQLTFGSEGYFNREVWDRVRQLGYLPIRIMSVPEGTKLAIDNAAFTIESTEDWFAGTVQALESTLMHTWYPTTIATRAMTIKDAITPYWEQSTDKDYLLPYAVNDFGYRGATSHEAAARGGAAFLVHFQGSDNMAANRAVKDYYGYSGRLKSVWATEHSVATSYGKGQGEIDYIKAQLERSNPESIISIVIDSYDPDNFIRNVVGNPEIKLLIRNRAGRTVFRPDSGIPLANVLKYSEMLGSIFGVNYNCKEFKVINDNVGLIQGDGMDETSIPELYRNYIEAGWSAENVVVGSGGGLLQVDANRDTSRWAIKASYAEFGDKHVNVQKDPKSDPTKRSKTGLLKLHRMANSYMTLSSAEETEANFNSYVDSFRVVFEDGELFKDNFQEILERANG